MFTKKKYSYLHKLRGFSMVELTLTIAVLGVLAVAALPQLFDISLTRARTNSMKATASAVQTALTIYAANLTMQGLTASYPQSLDSISGTSSGIVASNTQPLFANILQSGVSAQWFKLSSGNCYVFDSDGSLTLNAGDIYYQYNSSTGEFLQVSICS